MVMVATSVATNTEIRTSSCDEDRCPKISFSYVTVFSRLISGRGMHCSRGYTESDTSSVLLQSAPSLTSPARITEKRSPRRRDEGKPLARKYAGYAVKFNDLSSGRTPIAHRYVALIRGWGGCGRVEGR